MAESMPGAVTITLAGGTYTTQVTVAPSSSSPMTALTITGPTTATPATIEPTSLVQNVCEGATGHFFDDNTGPTAAILGVETGVAYSIDATTNKCSVTGTGSGATVAVENLTVSGAGLGL